ncbi:threonine ammonia-lyase [Hydrogenoanaerobacterium sp.]|uniref:threonine ammonia-lyase n=1 Tax=Hydrogenoanaerobacterium sp. TaxID=2953763 RepID=UPI00289DF6C7|nr:threonine ammonia-lyase [Hydrogenoanaerobacterium sp.]
MNVKEVESAAARLKYIVHHTPINSSRTFSQMSGAELFVKCENLQKTGSFKVRGAYNKLAKMSESAEVTSVVSSSAGNHAQGVAYAANALQMEASIVMPRSTPIAKVAATGGYGAKVVLHGDCYDDAYQKAVEIQQETGAVFVHPFDDEDVITGQGTVALEIFQDIPTVDAVLIPAGGGGLLAGMAFYIKQINPRVKVIGVQAQGADAIVQSFQAKAHRFTETSVTIADGISVKVPGKITTELINRYVDEMITVTDEEIAEAILLLLERTKMLVEPAGAVSLAAAIHKKTNLEGKRAVSVLSGGNIDVSFIHKIVEKGLITRGRQLKFGTVMLDIPGSLQRFSGIVAGCGANIIMVQYDRLHADLRLNEAILHIVCEVSGTKHGQDVIRQLEHNGYKVFLE